MTMPGKGPLVKQTTKLHCAVCRESKEHYRWNDRAMWTCIDINSHPDVTDIRVLQARIVELEDDNMQLRASLGVALQMNRAALPQVVGDQVEVEHTQPTLTEGLKHAEDIRRGVEQGDGPSTEGDGLGQDDLGS